MRGDANYVSGNFSYSFKAVVRDDGVWQVIGKVGAENIYTKCEWVVAGFGVKGHQVVALWCFIGSSWVIHIKEE